MPQTHQFMRLIITLLIFALFWNNSLQAQHYQNPDLPDAMTFLNGDVVKTKAEWTKRKEEIKSLWCEYIIGSYPDKTPPIISSEIIAEETDSAGIIKKRILLTFDTPSKKSFEIEVWKPLRKNEKPNPLFLTQPREYQIQWAFEAVKRGYIACLYPGLDAHHSEENYPGYQNVWRDFKNEYPEAGWDSSLGVQAWLASRTLDFLLSPQSGFNIDTTSVGIAGHSRYGKQSIYAAAFDERFKAVIARSSGTPTASSYRFASRQTFMESVADFPDIWAKNSLKDYLGRENELPIEGNALMATIAPRKMMIHTAYNDGSDPTFAVERNYLNAKKVYSFLGAEDNIYLSYRKGQHNPITEEHTRHMFDFFDWSFGKGEVSRDDFPEVLHHSFDWQEWKNRQTTQSLKPPKSKDIKKNIRWMLGEVPNEYSNNKEYSLKPDSLLGVPVWSRDRWNPGGLKRVRFGFANNMNGNIYFDPNRKNYKGTVVWLHPWNYSHGSNEGYGVQGTTIYWRLAQEGFIVVGYDQFGFGDHLQDSFGFYDNHPEWSLLGRAVSDVSKVINFVIEGKGVVAESVPETDPSRIYLCGFSYGGMVGLYAAALDKRIAGVASFSGFTPMRTDTDEKETGGIRRLWEWHHVVPKLGLFHDREKHLPYDYDDILKLIAPREALIYAPQRDRFANIDDVELSVKSASNAWSKSGGLVFKSPDDICRFQKDQQNVFLKWLEGR